MVPKYPVTAGLPGPTSRLSALGSALHLKSRYRFILEHLCRYVDTRVFANVMDYPVMVEL